MQTYAAIGSLAGGPCRESGAVRARLMRRAVFVFFYFIFFFPAPSTQSLPGGWGLD